MKLLAPINSLESCKGQINSGADEVYVGFRTDIFKKFNFSARYQIDNDGSFLMPSKAELKEIVKYAKDSNVVVNLTANTQYFSNFTQREIDIEKEYINYVLDGIECGIKEVIVTDIGLMYTLKEMNLPIRIHASTTLDTMSIAQVLFLKELGVSRAILSYQVSYNEIKEITKNKIMEIEVFGYGGCSFSGNCNLGHGLSLGVPCKNKYFLNGCQDPSDILDSTKGCGLCSIWDLNNLGVDTIKLVGREQYYKQISPVTDLFKTVLSLSQSTTRDEFDNKVKEIIPLWWKKAVCSKNQCKYMNGADQFYI